jgi:hypothetical protein
MGVNVAISGVLLKVGLPVLLAGGGIAAVLTAPESLASSTPAAVWIDSPASGVRLDAGAVIVVAHATAGSRVSSLTLEVDGTEVTSTDQLEQFDALVSAQFTWQATDGEHSLVVTGGGHRSVPVLVFVGAAAPTTQATTQATVQATTTTVAPTTTIAPTTVAPAPKKPTITNVVVLPTTSVCAGNNLVSVTASVTNATGGSARLVMTTNSANVVPLATTVSGGTLSGTFVANNFNLLTAWYTVVITATGPGGSTTITAGTLQSTCTKD